MTLFAAASTPATIRARLLLTRTRFTSALNSARTHSYRSMMMRYWARSGSKTGLVNPRLLRREPAVRSDIGLSAQKAQSRTQKAQNQLVLAIDVLCFCAFCG